MKDAAEPDIAVAAAIVREMCRQVGATFIIDDHVAIARTVGADGVHLGKNDMPPAQARRLLAPHQQIGGTANTFEDIERLCCEGVDYIGLGPFRFTQTKKDLSPVLGLDGYRSILSRCRAEGYAVPIVAIGGIAVDDIPAILATGVSGIALSGTILSAPDPVEETSRILKIVER